MYKRQTVKDTDMVTEYIRQALKRTITRKWSINGQIKVLTLEPDLEKMIIASINKNEHGSYLSIDPDTMQRIIDSLSKEIDRMRGNWGMPIVLTTPFLRIYLKKLVDQIRPGVAVLSFNEIDSSVQIQAVGKIS